MRAVFDTFQNHRIKFVLFTWSCMLLTALVVNWTFFKFLNMINRMRPGRNLPSWKATCLLWSLHVDISRAFTWLQFLLNLLQWRWPHTGFLARRHMFHFLKSITQHDVPAWGYVWLTETVDPTLEVFILSMHKVAAWQNISCMLQRWPLWILCHYFSVRSSQTFGPHL